jgi:hypothetical protein
VRTIYNHLPQELKDPIKVEARLGKTSDATLQQTVKTQDTPIQPTSEDKKEPRPFLETPLVCCNCGEGTRLYPENYAEIDGKTYCLKCAEGVKPKAKPKIASMKASPDAPIDVPTEPPIDEPEPDEEQPCLCPECHKAFRIIHKPDGKHALEEAPDL